ncbi:MAG: hypothetical protein JWR33_1131 [Naasia sp.]|uniref:DUF4129 domain-containing protein n=1 Tax=Naasia sp. TaxID=2546198 RepID=UPI0026310DE6|nr:DUF4129 domain-containing protein [Naasia sp.]MCU1570390.1 hypothetical protein [Naasia sp.]
MTPLLALARSVPVEPDGQQGRGWLLDELGKSSYQAARPTWFDLASQAFFDWLDTLLGDANDGQGAAALVVVVLLLTALLVAAFLVFGRPRLNRRSRLTSAVFGEDDARTADEMRAAAERAATAGDFTAAIAELFRAVARGLAERTLVDAYPGMTARGFARAASAPFPDSAGALSAAAIDFEDVRYLGRAGTEEQYRRMADLDRTLRARRPAPVGAR